jgi:hypothetical protein
MLRPKTLKSFCAITAVLMLAVVCVRCGSSSSNKLSAAQAQAVSQELMVALGDALQAGFSGVQPGVATPPRLPDVLRGLHPETSTGCTITNTGQNCDIPITYSGPCPNGGTIGVAGDFSFTLDNSGNGSDTSTLTITPTNCAVSNTTFNGDPNVTVTTDLLIQSYALGFPDTFTESGGISYGPNPSGSCTLNVNLSITSATTCSITGTVCGQSVNGSCGAP